MFKKISLPTNVAIAVTLILGALAKAETPSSEKASPTPTAKPQNQSVINSTKSNVKDNTTLPSPTPSPKSSPKQTKTAQGWDGKVQRQIKRAPATPTPTPSPKSSRTFFDKNYSRVQGASPTATPTPAKSR